MKKRIETHPSRTAEWTCICRAASSLEKRPCYKSDDAIALKILPPPISRMLRWRFYRKHHFTCGAPRGIYEYVIARTKYMDAAFQRALAEGFDQIAVLGAGYDSRAVRFPATDGRTRVFEFDSEHTQRLKLNLFQRNNLVVPPHVTFTPIDFEHEPLLGKLSAAGFQTNKRSLFVFEGVSMYLEPAAADATFRAMADAAGPRSRIVFDYVYADVLRREKNRYDETGLTKSGNRVNEAWRFGIEHDGLERFLADFGLRILDHVNPRQIEENYFRNERGETIGRVNGTQCFVTAEK